jgi:hypothetical protein
MNRLEWVSLGDNDYESAYLYVNPYPFNEKMVEQSLSIGNGIHLVGKELK